MGLLASGVAGVTAVKNQCWVNCQGSEGLTRRTLVSTLEQSPASRRYGCDPGSTLGARAGYQRDTEPTEVL
jgi:hypothetical protein